MLATRGAIGSILGGDRSELPANRLFFAGGGGSVRGYGYRNLGPRIGGEVVGGLSYLELSAEVRARVTESFGVVGFVDAGNAFAEPYPDFKGGLKVGVGAGIRYYTGLGPIRLDVAIPLDGQSGDPDFGIYAGPRSGILEGSMMSHPVAPLPDCPVADRQPSGGLCAGGRGEKQLHPMGGRHHLHTRPPHHLGADRRGAVVRRPL